MFFVANDIFKLSMQYDFKISAANKTFLPGKFWSNVLLATIMKANNQVPIFAWNIIKDKSLSLWN